MPYSYQPGGAGSSYALPTFNYASAMGGGFQAMINAYQSAYAQVQKTSEQRYQDILAGYRDLGAEQERLMAGVGEQRTKDIASKFLGMSSLARQEMTSAGMAGSGVMFGALGQIGREGERAASDWQDQLARMKLDVGEKNATNALTFMERRTDQYPDIGQFASLMAAYGNQGVAPSPYMVDNSAAYRNLPPLPGSSESLRLGLYGLGGLQRNRGGFVGGGSAATASRSGGFIGGGNLSGGYGGYSAPAAMQPFGPRLVYRPQNMGGSYYV